VADVRLEVLVGGRVQGVGFRYWTRDVARRLGLRGSAANLRDGRVAVVAEGSREQCEALLGELTSGRAPGHVVGVDPTWTEVRGEANDFRVR